MLRWCAGRGERPAQRNGCLPGQAGNHGHPRLSKGAESCAPPTGSSVRIERDNRRTVALANKANNLRYNYLTTISQLSYYYYTAASVIAPENGRLRTAAKQRYGPGVSVRCGPS